MKWRKRSLFYVFTLFLMCESKGNLCPFFSDKSQQEIILAGEFGTVLQPLTQLTKKSVSWLGYDEDRTVIITHLSIHVCHICHLWF